MKYIDAHCHLQNFENFLVSSSTDSRVASSKIECFVNAASSSDWCTVKRMSEIYPSHIIPFFGIHPWVVDSTTQDDIDSLEVIIKAMSCGIGEIGLDKAKDGIDYYKQLKVYTQQLELANKYAKPVTIHSVKAQQDCLKILEDFTSIPCFMIHSFKGSIQMVKEVLNRGGYISLSFSILKMNHKKLQLLVDYIPLDRLLLETDSPDCSLPRSAHNNYSEYFKFQKIPLNISSYEIRILYNIFARLKGIDQNDLVDIITKNCLEFKKGI